MGAGYHIPKETEACEGSKRSLIYRWYVSWPHRSLQLLSKWLEAGWCGPQQIWGSFLESPGEWRLDQFINAKYLTSGGIAEYSPECRDQSLILPSQTPGQFSEGCTREIQVYTFLLCSWKGWAPPVRACYFCFLFRNNCSYFSYRKRQFNVLPKLRDY